MIFMPIAWLGYGLFSSCLMFLTHPFWFPPLMMWIFRRMELFIEFKNVFQISKLSFTRDLSDAAPLFRKWLVMVSNLSYYYDKKINRIVVEIEEVKIRMMINFIYLNVDKHNILGYEDKELEERLSRNLRIILEQFIYFYWKLQTGDPIKTKKYQSSFEKLSSYFKAKKVINYALFSIIRIFIFRILEIRASKIDIEFDYFECKSISPEKDLLKKEQKERMKERMRNGPLSSTTIYYRYFHDSHRSRIVDIKLSDCSCLLHFKENEQFTVNLCSGTGELIMHGQETNRVERVAIANILSLNIIFPLKLNKTLAYINTEIFINFGNVKFILNHEKIELFMGFFWNIKLMNNIKSDARKQKFSKEMAKLQNEMFARIKAEYDAINSKYVRQDLIPAIPKRIEFTFRNLEWDLELDSDINSRLMKKEVPQMNAFLGCDVLKIRFKTKRIGKYLQSKRYKFSFMINIENINSYVDLPDSKERFKLAHIGELSFTHSISTFKRCGIKNHDKRVNMALSASNMNINYSSHFLVALESIFFLQIVFNNYNYVSYKQLVHRYVRLLEKRSNSGRISEKTVQKKDVDEAVRLSNLEAEEKSLEMFKADQDIESLRSKFKGERGLYEIEIIREYRIRNLHVELCDINNQKILGVKICEFEYDNNEGYPFRSYWKKRFNIQNIQFQDLVNRTEMGSIDYFNSTKLLTIYDDSDLTRARQLNFKVQSNMLLRLVTFFKEIGPQFSRLQLRKNKFRIRRKILSTFHNMKKDFISIYDIKKIQIQIEYPDDKVITIGVESVLKDLPNGIPDTLELLTVSEMSLEMQYTVKTKHTLIKMKTLSMRRNTKFMVNLEKLGEFKVYGIGNQDSRICTLLKRCYQLITLSGIYIEIPHNFHEYWPFLSRLKASVQELIKSNSSHQETYPGSPPKREKKVEFFKFLVSKYFISFTKISLKVLNNPIEIPLLRKNKIRNDFLAEIGNGYDSRSLVNQIRFLKDYSPPLIEFKLSELSIDISDYCEDQDLEIYSKKLIKFMHFCDRFSETIHITNFKSIMALRTKIYAHSFAVKLMDYPIEILKFKFFSLDSQFVLGSLRKRDFLKDILGFGHDKVFYFVEIFVDKPEVNYGLNLTFALRPLIKFAKDIQAAIQKDAPITKKNEQKINPGAVFLQQIITKGGAATPDIITPMPWDLTRFKYHGKFRTKIHNLGIHMLTSTSPYRSDSLELSAKIIYFEHSYMKFKFYLEKILFRRLEEVDSVNSFSTSIRVMPPTESPIIHFPILEMLITWNWNPANHRLNHYFLKDNEFGNENTMTDFIARKLDFSVNLNIPKRQISSSEENSAVGLRAIVTQSMVPIVHYQSNLFSWLIQVPQLSKEYLILLGINPFKYNGDSEKEDKEKGKGAMSIHTNYIELMTFHLNDQLNEGRSQNFIKFVSKVNIKAVVCSIRVLFTNNEKVFKAKIMKKRGMSSQVPIIGLQGAVESVQFQCELFKKSMTARTKNISKISKGHKEKWAMRRAKSSVDMVYVSLFDGANLLDMNPANFVELRKKNWKWNINNPESFNSFFKLKNINLDAFTSDQYDIKSNHLFRFELAKDFVPRFMKDTPDPVNSELNNVKHVKNEFFPKETMRSSANNSRFVDDSFIDKIDEEQPTKDLDFTPAGVFFKANMILYKQNYKMTSEKARKSMAKEFNKHTSVEFEHFLTFKGCKLLITFNLRIILTNLFFEPFKNVKSILKRVPKKAKRSTNADDKSKTGAFTKTQGASLINEVKNSKVTTKYRLGLRVINPQFNINDFENKIQILFASKQDCMVLTKFEYLEFDRFEQDPRIQIMTTFNKLELFTVNPFINPENDIYWIEDAKSEPLIKDYSDCSKCSSADINSNSESEDISEYLNVEDINKFVSDIVPPKATEGAIISEKNIHEFIRQGVLNRISLCSEVSAKYTYYKLGECLIDFTKPVETSNIWTLIAGSRFRNYWNGRLRMKKATVEVEHFTSVMNSQDFDLFTSMTTFLMNLVAIDSINSARNIELEAKNRRLLEELKEKGPTELIKQLQRKIKEKIDSGHIGANITPLLSLKYRLRQLELKMTEGEKEVMRIHIYNCHGLNVFKKEGFGEIRFGIGNFQIDNPNIEQGEGSLVLSRMDKPLNYDQYETVGSKLLHNQYENEALVISQRYFNVPGATVDGEVNIWKAVMHTEIIVAPLIVNVTKEIFIQLSEYFFAKENTKAESKIEEDIEFQQLYLENEELYLKLKAQRLKKLKNADIKDHKSKGTTKETETLQIPPTYYENITVNDLNLVVTFKSNKLFMNFKRMKMFLKSFEKQKKLYTRKNLFDRIKKHIIKNAVLPILRNKILGVKAKKPKTDKSKEIMKEIDENKRLLLGPD